MFPRHASDFLRSGCLSAALALASSGAAEPQEPLPPDAEKAAPDSTTRPPRPLHRESPVYPAALAGANLSGTAEIILAVNSIGEVIDSKIAKASHAEFGKAALAAALKWTFEPGLKGGRPAPQLVSIPFVFSPRALSPVEQALGRMIFREIGDDAVDAETLPTRPVPRQKVWPRYPETLRGSKTKGYAVVMFVIDYDGAVINPEVVESTHDAFNGPALAAAVALSYPPVRNAEGKGVCVSMVIRFDFDESMLKEQEKASQARIVVPEHLARRRRGPPPPMDQDFPGTSGSR